MKLTGRCGARREDAVCLKPRGHDGEGHKDHAKGAAWFEYLSSHPWEAK